MTLAQQMANIGSESYRATKWLAKGRNDIAERAFERTQELIDLTIAYGRKNASNRKALLKEICRFEVTTIVFCPTFGVQVSFAQSAFPSGDVPCFRYQFPQWNACLLI